MCLLGRGKKEGRGMCTGPKDEVSHQSLCYQSSLKPLFCRSKCREKLCFAIIALLTLLETFYLHSCTTYNISSNEKLVYQYSIETSNLLFNFSYLVYREDTKVVPAI
jgi:hypothetical protein